MSTTGSTFAMSLATGDTLKYGDTLYQQDGDVQVPVTYEGVIAPAGEGTHGRVRVDGRTDSPAVWGLLSLPDDPGLLTLPARVAAGAALLDAQNPGWHLLVNIEKLVMHNDWDCILGQLYDAYNRGLRKIGLLCPDGTADLDKSLLLGFDVLDRHNCEYEDLTEQWQSLIAARIGVPAGTEALFVATGVDEHGEDSYTCTACGSVDQVNGDNFQWEVCEACGTSRELTEAERQANLAAYEAGMQQAEDAIAADKAEAAKHAAHDVEVHYAGAPGTGTVHHCNDCDVDFNNTIRELSPGEVI